jgi:hypothetical protein
MLNRKGIVRIEQFEQGDNRRSTAPTPGEWQDNESPD